MAKKFRVFPDDGYSYSYETTYREYINSADWRFKADRFRAAKNYTCEKCGQNNDDYYSGRRSYEIELHVHHRHYKTLGNERQEDVLILCKMCHSLHHGKW